MHWKSIVNNKSRIKKILQKGFTRLEINQQMVAETADEILEHAIMVRKKDSGIYKIQFRPNRFYAMAASIILCVISIFLISTIIGKTDKKDTENVYADQIDKLNKSEKFVILSVAGDSSLTSEMSRDSQEEISTDKESQLLLAVGSRTRAILYENTSINISKADSEKTSIILNNGLLSVDIASGKKDTISVLTSYGNFIQIGTRFSVYVDSHYGAVLKVYDGIVKVEDKSGTEIMVGKNQKWHSKNNKNVFYFQPGTEECQIDDVFLNNKINDRLIWNQDNYIDNNKKKKANVLKEKPVSKKCNNYSGHNLKNANVEKSISDLLAVTKYESLEEIVRKIENPEILNNVYRLLKAEVKRKCDIFRYNEAAEIMKIIIYNYSFRENQREDTWMQYYLLHKKYLNASVEKKLKLTQDYINLFPVGNIGDDMTSETIHLQLMLNRYSDAVNSMRTFIRKYQKSSKCEYFSYLLASTVRERHKNLKEALKLYQNYVSSYPYGRYEEDAFYWIIQLSFSEGDKKTSSKYKDIYMERYSKGKWSKELESLKLVSSD